MADRWAKLNTNWMESDWLVVLSAESRLAWVQLICYVKAYGVAGRVKAKSAMVFARQNFIGEESVEQLLRAAKLHGAMTEDDGHWVLTGWKKHQGDETAAERNAKLREKKKAEALRLAQSEENDTEVTRNARNVTAEEIRLDKKRLDINPPKSPLRTWEHVLREVSAAAEGGNHSLDDLKLWLDYKRQRKDKPWTEIGVAQWCAEYLKWPPDRLKNAILHTVRNGWVGIVEPSHGSQPQEQAPSKPRLPKASEVAAR